MAIIHINNLNPKLKNFLFESRKLVLKNAFGGFGYRCYTKQLGHTFQYLTMVPNSGQGYKPVDFFSKYSKGIIKPYLLMGSYLEEMPVSEYINMLKKIEEILELEGYLEIPSDKLDILKDYYQTKIFSDSTIEKMLHLSHYFDASIKEGLIYDFNYAYYKYYNFVENARKQRIESAILADKISSLR